MAKLGPNVKMHVTEANRDRLRSVMTEVFDAKRVHTDDKMDIFELEGSRIGAQVIAAAEAPSPAVAKATGTWLEIVVDDPKRTSAALASAGLERFEYANGAHDYFQLPGGQVVRVAGRQ